MEHPFHSLKLDVQIKLSTLHTILVSFNRSYKLPYHPPPLLHSQQVGPFFFLTIFLLKYPWQ